jgi:hypothetical protein
MGKRDPFRSVIDVIPLSICWKDSDSRYIGCNAVFTRAGDLGLSQKSRLLSIDWRGGERACMVLRCVLR